MGSVPNVMSRLTHNPVLRAIFYRWPRIQPLMREINGLLTRRALPTFVGWEMITWHQVPWTEDAAFAAAMSAVRRFERTYSDATSDVDALRWRHWNVSYSVRHAQEHARPASLVGVECGVGDGLTAFFALSASSGIVHLYDAWSRMRADHMLPSEKYQEGNYRTLSRDVTEKNLREVSGRVVWHPGYIPETLDDTAPDAIHWLHIDLNSAMPTLHALEFFWPRLARGGVALFDDYGWLGWGDTRRTIDAFLADKPGTLLPLPTGQALYFR